MKNMFIRLSYKTKTGRHANNKPETIPTFSIGFRKSNNTILRV